VKAVKKLVAAVELSAATLIRGDFELVARVRESALKDATYQQLLRQSPLPRGQQTRDGLLWMGSQLVVPDDKKLRTDLIWEMHDTPLGAHAGRNRTLSALKQRFWWSGMTAEVADYVSTCDLCQRAKHSRQLTPGLLRPLPVPEEIDSSWTLDFLTGLCRTADGHNAIQGHFSRGGNLVRLIATTTNTTAERAADDFISSVVRHHGVPESLVSDRDPKFVAAFWQTLWKRLGTRLDMSTAHHAQTDGKSERNLGTITTVLRAFADEFPDSWDKLLPLVELALNSLPHESAGMSPYELLYGRNPALTVDRALSSSSSSTPAVDINVSPSAGRDAAEARWQQMREAWQSVRTKLGVARDRMKAQADKHRRDLAFQVGDLVLLSTAHLKIIDPQYNRKLGHLYCGPFPVLEVVGENAYRLDLPKQLSGIHPVINISHLREYRDGRSRFPHRPAAVGLSRPPPNAVDPAAGDAEGNRWDVERILAKRGQKYLVKWVGYPYEESTWEPKSGLSGAKESVQDFEDLQKTLRHPPSASTPRPAAAAAVPVLSLASLSVRTKQTAKMNTDPRVPPRRQLAVRPVYTVRVLSSSSSSSPPSSSVTVAGGQEVPADVGCGASSGVSGIDSFRSIITGDATA
jgi:hypothetical protein